MREKFYFHMYMLLNCLNYFNCLFLDLSEDECNTRNIVNKFDNHCWIFYSKKNYQILPCDCFFFSRFSENILHLKLLELTLENVFLM